ncbi:NADP-dependent oxidoreductase [Microbacterium sp. P04]|uniref:NADP-dependent oxidoreductase n=1 Tax=Microbacterium sp. P04 TaxID=3366947 RepID=UPI0037473DE6
MAKQWVATSWGSPDKWQLVETVVAAPAPGEVTITVHASGVNPADYKHVATARAGANLPAPIGYEISGVISAIGPDTEIVTGGGSVGDEVIAFRVEGGYASELTVPAQKVLAKPTTLSHPEAANLLLVGTTASEMLAVTDVKAGDTIVLHGASGAVGVSVLQQAAVLGIRVIGTASEGSFDRVRRFGGIPVAYGPGLIDRIRAAADAPIAAALDAVGTDEAVDVSLELVADRQRIVTVAAPARAAHDGFRIIAGAMPASAAYRDTVRPHLVDLAEQGLLQVPMARTFPLDEAPAAMHLLAEGHPGGKLALLP